LLFLRADLSQAEEKLPNDERRTPRWLFARINEQFKFTVDAAAAAENALCERYWTKETDGLKQDWTGCRIWCNPPYSRGQLRQWIQKASDSAAVSVLLIPGDCSTVASQLALATATEICFLNQRLRFDDEGNGAKFCNWLVLFDCLGWYRSRLRGLNLGAVLTCGS